MRLPIRSLLAASLASIALNAHAEPKEVPEAGPPASEPSAAAGAMSIEEMEAASGGQGVSLNVLTQQQLTGTTSGNTVTAGTLTSGEVSFGPGALDGFSGVGNFVINTGANNTLQGAINISVATTPGL